MTITKMVTITPTTDSFQLNGYEFGAQFGSTLLALSSGGFAVVYGNQFTSSSTLAMSVYSTEGDVVASFGNYVLPFTGSALSVHMSGDPLIDENADGTVLLRWNSDDNSFGHGTDLMTASVNPLNGIIARAQTLVTNTTKIGNMALAVTANGNQATLVQDAAFESLRLNMKDANGSHIAIYAVGDAFKDYGSVDIVTLADDRLLLAATVDGTGSTNPIHLQFRLASGLADGTMFVIDQTGPADTDTNIKLAALPGGGFAIAYRSDFNNQSGVTLRIVSDLINNPDGTGPIRVDVNLAAVESDLDIVALPNGWVAISWTETAQDGTTDILARVYDQTGTAKTDTFLVSSGTSNADESSLAILANGQLVASWTDELADASGDSIRGRILDFLIETIGDDADNELVGDALMDVMRGGRGNDILDGKGGNDTLFGGRGKDTIKGGDGNDLVTGGSGRDLVELGTGNDVFFDNAQSNQFGKDTVFGGHGNDTINGGGGNDVFHGDDGDDLIYGGDGDDRVWGGNGRDIAYLGNGDDVFYDNTQNNEHSHDTVFGGIGNDTINGGGGNDVFHGGVGKDILTGGNNYDTLYGGDGDDRVWGGNGRDIAYLGNGDDVFYDNTQNNEHSHDTVFGGIGNDTINVGGGNDVLTGGDGSDTFRFNTAQQLGSNTITDFVRGADLLEMSGVIYADLTFSATGSGVRVEWDDGSVKLDGINVSLIAESDFLFV